MKCFHDVTPALAVMLAVALAPADLPGATITVTSTADSGPGSLRVALASAANGDTIDATGVSGTILLANELLVSKSLAIFGPGPAKLSVDGNGTNRVFRVAPSNTVTISSLKVTNGAGPSYLSPTNKGGGGILNDHSTLTLSNCVISGNYGGNGFGYGGGILNYGRATLTISHCALIGNVAGDRGGGIYNFATASVQVLDSALNSNSATFGSFGLGGGIYNLGSAQLVNSTLNGNHAGWGGGICNDGYQGSASAEVVSSTVSGNSADEVGAAIYNYIAPLTVSNSTLSGNSAFWAGGIYNYIAPLTVGNSTLSGNSAHRAGGIYNSSRTNSTQIVSSTLSDNSADEAGSIYNLGPGVLELGSTILKAGASGGSISNFLGSVASLGYNLSSDDGGGFLTSATDQINTDPLLGPLQDNGGPTFTHALLCGSPAIDKGKNLGGLATDQRDLPRTFDDPLIGNAVGGDGTDIGAFEHQEICTQSPWAGVGILGGLVENSNLRHNRKHPLLVSLEGACESFERGHLKTGINHLQAFEHKVRSQVQKSDPALAQQLIAITEAIISTLGGG